MAESNIIRVLTVDDHTLVRKGIRFTLLAIEDIELVGEAQSGEEALIECAEQQPDVVLMDMRLQGEMDGIMATRAIRNRFPKIQVIALSSFFEPEMVRGVMQVGAIGYIVKGSSRQELVEAIRAAHSGHSTLASEAVKALFKESNTPTSLGADLTEGEIAVLELLVEGLSNPQIAERQNFSVSGVKYHVSNILSKLGASNRTEAALLAREHNLVSKDQ